MELEKRYNELCRLCATYDSTKLDIFSEQGKKRQLSKKIQSFLPFKVDEHDAMPKSLCYNCVYNLENAYSFRCRCIQATYNLEKYLQRIEEDRKVKDETLNRLHRIRPEVSIFAIPNNSSKCNESVDINNSSMLTNEESVPNPLDFVEVGVGLEEKRTNSSTKSNRSNSKDGNKKWTPQGNSLALFGHTDDSVLSRRKNLNPRKIAREIDEKMHPCNTSTPLTSHHHHQHHHHHHHHSNSTGTSGGGGTTLPTPGLIAISIGAPTCSLTNSSSNHYISACVNNQVETTMTTLESILSSDVKSNTANAAAADSMVITPEIMHRPSDEKENSHCDWMETSERKSYSCLLCEKSFTLRSSLNRHFLAVHGIEPADVMPQLQSGSHSILNHFVQQNDRLSDDQIDSSMVECETIFLCEVCRREFHDRASLWLHMVHAHREEAAVSCGICLKICCDNITLIEHVNTAHASDKDVVQRRYSCQVCGRQHDSRQKLLKHATLHTLIDNQGQAIQPEEMILLNNAFAPRECNVCHKKFFNDEKLNLHIQNFHSDVNNSSSHGVIYKCELCISSHATRMDRWWHMYHSHSGDSRVTCERNGCNKIFVTQVLKEEHLRSHHELQGDYTNTCEVCGKLWESRVVFYKHMMNVHPKCLPSVCGVCLKIFSSVSELRSHVQGTHFPLDENEGVCCDICGRFYGERSKMLRHRRVHNVTDDAPSHGGSKKKDDLQCSFCPDTEFTTLEAIGEHRRTVHQLFVCDLCPKYYNGNNHLWKHVSKQHRGNPEVTCDLCLRTSASKAHLERHKLKYHSDPIEKLMNKPSSGASTAAAIHKCNLCSKVFRIRSLLKKHLKTCKGARPRMPKVQPVNGVFPCTKCTKVFDYETTLGKHMKYAHIMHYCEICAKGEQGYDLKKDLMAHIRESHANHPELECDVPGCGKIFRMKVDLRKHKLEHPRGYFSYMCEICGDLYSNKKKLRKHLQTYHRDDVKYLCGVCNAIYPSMEELVNHVHTIHPYVLRRPFTCQICGKGWSISSKVVEHIGKFHGRHYKPCKTCWKVFDNDDEYQHHIDNHPPAPEKPPPQARKFLEPKEKSRNISKELVDLGIATADGTLKRTAEDDLNMSDDNTKRLRKRYSCKSCKLSFRLSSELTEHNESTHPESSFSGDDDDEKEDANAAAAAAATAKGGAAGESDRKRRLWTEVQRVVCGSCKRVWNTKKQLWQHIIRSHPIESQYTCGICLKVCRNYSDLAYHLDSCHNTFMKENHNRFACRVCGHYHNSQCKLDKHRSMHKDPPPYIQYSCNYCDRIFKSKIFFYEHINKHKSKRNDFKFRFKKLYLIGENDINDPEIRHVLQKDTECESGGEEVVENTDITYEYEELMDKKALEISENEEEDDDDEDTDAANENNGIPSNMVYAAKEVVINGEDDEEEVDDDEDDEEERDNGAGPDEEEEEEVEEDEEDDEDEDDDEDEEEEDDEEDEEEYPNTEIDEDDDEESNSVVDPLRVENKISDEDDDEVEEEEQEEEAFDDEDDGYDEDDDTDMKEVRGFEDDCEMEHETNDEVNDSIFTSATINEESSLETSQRGPGRVGVIVSPPSKVIKSAARNEINGDDSSNDRQRNIAGQSQQSGGTGTEQSCSVNSKYNLQQPQGVGTSCSSSSSSSFVKIDGGETENSRINNNRSPVMEANGDSYDQVTNNKNCCILNGGDSLSPSIANNI